MSILGSCCRYSSLLGVSIVAGIIFFFALQNGLITDFGESDPNLCTMTYMYPDYVKVPMGNFSRHGKKYGLYFYRDAQLVKSTRPTVQNLGGVPVLFIPGNAGSYRQIRSLGTTYLRNRKTKDFWLHRIMNQRDMAREKEYYRFRNILEFFAIDFQEELSAFNGDILFDQQEFVTDCINKILSIYRDSKSIRVDRPDSVLLLGHSMGGLLARSVFSSPTYRNKTVHTIVTLSTPHVTAPVMLHQRVFDFYEQVNTMWRQQGPQRHPDLSNVALVSIGGGWRDAQVPALLSNLENAGLGLSTLTITSPPPQTNDTTNATSSTTDDTAQAKSVTLSQTISTVATSIPDVWISQDHVSCMWCNQLVAVMSSVFSGLADPETGQAFKSLADRLSHLHLYFSSSLPSALGLDSSNAHVRWSPTNTTLYHGLPNMAEVSSTTLPLLRLSGLSTLRNYSKKINLDTSDNKKTLQIYTTMPLEDVEIGLCSETECVNLLPSFAPLPYDIHTLELREHRTVKANVQMVDLSQYASYRTLYVNLTGNKENYTVNAVVYRGHYVKDLFFMAHIVSDPGLTPLEEPSLQNDVSHDVSAAMVSRYVLPQADKYQPIQVDVVQKNCKSTPIVKPVVMGYSKKMKEEQFGSQSLTLRFHDQSSSEPGATVLGTSNLFQGLQVGASREAKTPVQVVIFSDPICSYELKLSVSLPAKFNVILRNHGVLIIGLTVFIAMLAAGQLQGNATSTPSTALQALPRLLTSPWTFFVPLAYYTLLHLIQTEGDLIPDLFKSHHSFASTALPWPRWDVLAFLMPFPFALLGIWLLLWKIVGLFVDRRSGANQAAEATNRSPIRVIVALVTLLVLGGVAIGVHAGASVILSLLLLKLWNPRRGLSEAQLTLKRRKEESLFVMYSPMLLVLVPEMVVWIKEVALEIGLSGGGLDGILAGALRRLESFGNLDGFVGFGGLEGLVGSEGMAGVLQLVASLDCFKLLALALALHTVSLKWSTPSLVEASSRSVSVRKRAEKVLASLGIVTFALFPVFRAAYILSVISVLDTLDLLLLG